MIEDLSAFNKNISHALNLKSGVHQGRSFAVILNERIDYFGQNVNIATRTQTLADANEVYLSREGVDSPGVQDLLNAHS